MKNVVNDMDRGPGSRPLSEDEMMEMVFSKWGAQLGLIISGIFGLYVFFSILLP